MFLGSDFVITIRFRKPDSRRQCFRKSIYTSAPRLEGAGYGGLLATGPWQFQGMSNVVRIPFGSFEAALHVNVIDVDFMMTNRGIRICLPIQLLDRELKIYVAFLACGCGSPSADSSTVFAIYLHQLSDNLYTRIYQSRLRGNISCDLVENPVKMIRPSSARVCRSLSVDAPDEVLAQKPPRDTSALTRVTIDISRLHSTLQKSKFTLFNESWDQEIRSTGCRFKHDFSVRDQRGPFFVVKNEFAAVELLLVVTSNLMWTNNGWTLSGDVGVRAITLGPEGLLSDAKHARSPREIYHTWRQRTKADDLPALSRLATARMSNGQEIVFTTIRDKFSDWHLLAVLRDRKDESKFPVSSAPVSYSHLKERRFHRQYLTHSS